MVIDGGNYVSNGVGSPAIYSTADIAVSNATLTANGSEAICIEGLNSIHLYDCDLTGNMSDLDQNDNTWTVILYQSMSGDSEVGNSTFQMDGGSLTSENGGVFYTTNTESTITLNNVDINYNDDNEFFLQCTGNTNQRGWGQAGANGADCHFTGISHGNLGMVLMICLIIRKAIVAIVKSRVRKTVTKWECHIVTVNIIACGTGLHNPILITGLIILVTDIDTFLIDHIGIRTVRDHAFFVAFILYRCEVCHCR